MRRIFYSLVLLLSIACVCSATGSGEWTSVTSEHFSLAGDAPQVELRAIAKRLELSRIVVSRSMPWLDLDRGHPLDVIVFADAAEFREFKPRRGDGTPDDAVAGYYLHGQLRDTITLAADTNDMATATHEYVHYVLRSNTPAPATVPAWLDEGLAQYFESFSVSAGGTVITGLEPRNRLAAIRKSGLTVPEGLFGDKPPMLRGSDEQRALFYAWAWACVHFLEQRSDEDNIRDLLAPKQTTGSDLPHVADGVQRYVASVNLPSKTLQIGTTTIREPVTSPLGPARADTLAGQLLIELGRSADAENYLQRALSSDKSLADAHASLGMLLARDGKFDAAIDEIQRAIRLGHNDALTEFFLCYAITHAGAVILDLDDAKRDMIRSSLEKAVGDLPDLPEAAQLLALVYLETGSHLTDATSLLRRAISLQPGDETLQLMLAKALIRQENVNDAKVVAVKLTAASDPNVRAEAKALVEAAEEYSAVQQNIVLEPKTKMPWTQPYVFLKRSWLGTDDLRRIDDQLRNHNTNVMLGPLHTLEQRVVGTIEDVNCSNGVTYKAIIDGKPLALRSPSFDSVRLAVLLEGSSSFKLDCGVDLSQTLTVITYVPGKSQIEKPRLTGITFVPHEFKLQTPSDVSDYRTLIIDDDGLRRGPGDQIIHAGDLPVAERWTAIARELRKPAGDEKRMVATLTHVDCDQGPIALTATAGDALLKLSAPNSFEVKVKWFTTENTDKSMGCKSDLAVPNVLITYKPIGTTGGELRAMEFLPSGFSLPGEALTEHLR